MSQVMMMPAAPTMGLPAPPQPAVNPLAPRGITVVPIPLETMGGLRFQENSYSITLQGILSRADFDEIVRELNKTCDKYAPNVGGHKAFMFIPLFGLAAIPVLHHKLANFKKELSAQCSLLSKQYAKRGINLRLVEVPYSMRYGGAGYQGYPHYHGSRGTTTFLRVELEVTL